MIQSGVPEVPTDAATSKPGAYSFVINQAVILVGGLGSRLGHLTADTPKPLLEVAGRPFLVRLMEELGRHQIDNLVLLAGFKAEKIDSVVAGWPNARVLVEPEPLGTGGALRFARDYLCDKFFLLNGDSLFDINIWDLVLAANSGFALALRHVEDVSRYGAVDFHNGFVTAFAERAARRGPGLINGGVGVLSREVVDLIPTNRAVSIEGEVYPVLAQDGKLGGRVYDRPFIDIGVPADFERAQTWIPKTLTRGAVVFRLCDLVSGSNLDSLPWTTGACASIKAVNDIGFLTIVEASPLQVSNAMNAACQLELQKQLNLELIGSGAHIDAFIPQVSDRSPTALTLWASQPNAGIHIDLNRVVIFRENSMIIDFGRNFGQHVVNRRGNVLADVSTALSYII